jgi:2-oxoglutarate ferredoxin oxidoreductase subunit alpha
MSEKVLMKGNEAFAEAAIRGGCRFYFGYPSHPRVRSRKYMSRELPKRGGTFLQAGEPSWAPSTRPTAQAPRAATCSSPPPPPASP